ncbi:MAG: hypothetical protein P0S96_02105 [Simkaniaceae bacterium]|nr:hypothetical protein [Candidatus Sacchlamyda saccharinae]
MLQEDLEDAASIIDNILTQPLSVPGAKADVSLLDAAKNFASNEAMTSDLRKILLSFLQFPAQTDTLLRELEIIKEEL